FTDFVLQSCAVFHHSLVFHVLEGLLELWTSAIFRLEPCFCHVKWRRTLKGIQRPDVFGRDVAFGVARAKPIDSRVRAIRLHLPLAVTLLLVQFLREKRRPTGAPAERTPVKTVLQ